ncbi:equatorin [Myotis myotis]|uniref:equatorin n=1 Tax=Myotis myotis TaxID=51298 RepID=UPI00174C4358|nr:equatorin [Myotis myotis]
MVKVTGRKRVGSLPPERKRKSCSEVLNVPGSTKSQKVYVEPLVDEEHKEEIKHNIPYNDKNDHHFKEEKNYVFTTQTPTGSQSEISVKATTAVDFSLRNYKLNETSGTPSEEPFIQRIPRTTEVPNEPAFWTMLAKVLNETVPEEEARDQLFQAIPSSDLNATSEDQGVAAQDNKLKLMLGISLLTLLLFTVLLASSSALLYKLKTTYNKQLERQYSVHPELASLSYFQPAQGVSDTSFSRSPESSTLLDPGMGMTTSDEYMR